eukprot:TRINITY_DN3211_c0_g1_i1.p1 TRINITY_DN3211_c0_g1~~TRINITY_DN3211_c0_g1_i1.p1  ORF type:complete len:117 (-),score=34.70 TRINITY_DN3211_c0_g1_i1:292-642(-)
MLALKGLSTRGIASSKFSINSNKTFQNSSFKSNRKYTSHDPETNNPNRPGQKQKTDAEKSKNLRGESHSPHKEFKGWSEELASNSEQVVKAEKSSNKSVKEMQNETVKNVEKKHGK